MGNCTICRDRQPARQYDALSGVNWGETLDDLRKVRKGEHPIAFNSNFDEGSLVDFGGGKLHVCLFSARDTTTWQTRREARFRRYRRFSTGLGLPLGSGGWN